MMSITEFLKATIEEKLSLDEQKAYLLKNPFPSSEELARAIEYLKTQMSEVPALAGAIDVCGTGGSGLPRINTSTISSFVVAAAGVPVAKHGNNAASGRFGSFDLLDALGVPTVLSNHELQLRFRQYNLAFLYARSFHPIMKHFAPVRAELKVPTFFNILGPLLSPINAQKQIIGTPKREYAMLIAETAKALGKQKILVVTGSDGLDEVTLRGPTHVIELTNGRIKEYDITPADFGIKEINNFNEISSNSAEDNIKFSRDILSGTDTTRRTDLVLVNAALALYLAGKAKDLKACYELAHHSLVSRRAAKVLEDYKRPSVLTTFLNQKRSFTISSPTPSPGFRYSGGLIAEVKRSSPSEGSISSNLDIVKQAKAYQSGGAAAISVLTESEHFGGSFDDLQKIRQAVNLPILCKDFIASPNHINTAKAAGADIILLITAMLSLDRLKKLYDYALSLGLQVLVEVHNQDDLDKALTLHPRMIGINSRDLNDFSIYPQTFDLRADIPKDVVTIAESGIEKFADIPLHFDGALVGTVLMKHPFPRLKVKELTGRPLIKLCGIRTVSDARLCEKLGVDMIGINFVPRSHRCVEQKTAKTITAVCTNTISIGIFEDQTAKEVNRVAAATGVAAVQLSGNETDLTAYEEPIIKTIKPGTARPKDAFLTIIDGQIPGSGKVFDHSKLTAHEPSLIAGGITLEIAKNLQIQFQPLGYDVASGIETNGQVDPKKIEAFAKLFA